MLSRCDLFFVDMIGQSRTHVNGSFGIKFSCSKGTANWVNLIREDFDSDTQPRKRRKRQSAEDDDEPAAPEPEEQEAEVPVNKEALTEE